MRHKFVTPKEPGFYVAYSNDFRDRITLAHAYDGGPYGFVVSYYIEQFTQTVDEALSEGVLFEGPFEIPENL